MQSGEENKMENFSNLFQNLIEAARKHEQYREQECINMIASEGLKSPAVKQMHCLSHDLEGRYAEGENDLEVTSRNATIRARST